MKAASPYGSRAPFKTPTCAEIPSRMQKPHGIGAMRRCRGAGIIFYGNAASYCTLTVRPKVWVGATGDPVHEAAVTVVFVLPAGVIMP